MPSLPTGTVTLLFTDIEGSIALLQRLGDRRYAEVLTEHRQVLRDAFAKGHGQEIDTQGDAFLVAFFRARDAVARQWPCEQAPFDRRSTICTLTLKRLILYNT